MITMYDILMLAIVVVGIIQGAWRGMAWQLAPIVSLVLGYIVSYSMSVQAAPYFGNPPFNRLWAMIAIYLGVSLVVYMVARSIRHSLEKMKLVEFDRHLGALLGGVKAVLFTVVLTMGLITVSDQARDIILKSESSTISARLMNTISPILPKPLNDLIHPYLKNLNSHLPEIADNPTYTLPKPPVLIPRRVATQDKLAKPTRFSDEELDAVPSDLPAWDDTDLPPPREPRTPASRPTVPSRNTPVPRLSTRPAPAMVEEDEFEVPVSRPRPAVADPRDTVPAPMEDDDFFGADPDRALQSSKSKPR